MEPNKEIIIKLNIKRIIIIAAALCLLLIAGFFIDDYKYRKSFFGFDESGEYTAIAVEKWDQYGCSYFYQEDQEEALDNYEAIIEDDRIIDYVKRNTAIYGVINLYSDEQIENAFNAIVYGCNDTEHDTGKYESVADIPERLFRNCYLQMIMPNNMDESIKEVYEEYLNELKEE